MTHGMGRAPWLALALMVMASAATAAPGDRAAERAAEREAARAALEAKKAELAARWAERTEAAKPPAAAKAPEPAIDQPEPVSASELPPAGPDAAPRLLHQPVSSAVAGEPLGIRSTVAGDWQLAELNLRYRVIGTEDWRSVPVERERSGAWVATIPASDVHAVGLEYYFESRAVDGTTRRHFASAEAPHPVRVDGDSPADTQRDQLARYDGARSRLRVEGTFVAYGSVDSRQVFIEPGQTTDRFSDRLWDVEAEYTYRPLTWLHDMRFGVGLMRAEWPEIDGQPVTTQDTPGLNYGYAEINVELHRWFSFGGRLVLGASGLGFTAGVGGVVRVGDISGNHFAARMTRVGDIGTETDLRFHVDTVPRVPLSVGIEFTNWPTGDWDAANLSFTGGYELVDGWTVTVRAGTTGRSRSLVGGFQGGLGLMADF